MVLIRGPAWFIPYMKRTFRGDEASWARPMGVTSTDGGARTRKRTRLIVAGAWKAKEPDEFSVLRG
jgi:hypothetical protein